jgi:hypothetical protein
MNPPSNNLLTSCWMVSRLSGMYLLSFCLIVLYDGLKPNLCSITSLGISGISDICHTKTSRFSQRKAMSMTSYLASTRVLIRSFLSGLLGSTKTSLSSASFFFPSTDLSVGCWMDAEVPYAPFLADRGRGEAIISGLGTGDFNDVLPPCIFPILVAYS